MRAAMQNELKIIYSKDPWRNIGGVTNLARGDGWFEFQGRVDEILPGGILFKGKFGQILTIHTDKEDSLHLVTSTDANGAAQRSTTVSASSSTSSSTRSASSVQDTSYQNKLIYGDDVFFVEGFPYPANIGQGFEQMLAFNGSYFTYTNGVQTVTVPRFIYGTPCQKILSAEEIAAMKSKADAAKKSVSDRVLKANQDAAGRGDAYGLLRMGERYRDGEGVDKDLAKARDYLQRAADAGSPTAADDLKKL